MKNKLILKSPTSRLEKISIKNKWILEPPHLKARGKLFPQEINFLAPKPQSWKNLKQKQMYFEIPQNLKAENNLNQKQMA